MCRCGERVHDNWPAHDGSQLCQMCWEAECSEDWWRMVGELEEFCEEVEP